MPPDPLSVLDLLVLAELNADVVVDCGAEPIGFGQAERLVPDVQLQLGSSGAITACGAARLGVRVAVVGAVGADHLGGFVLGELAARGVDTAHCPQRSDRRTGATVVLSRTGGDRALLTFEGEIGRLAARDVPQSAVRGARHVHVSSYFLQRDLQPGLPALLAAARRHGATTSVDPGYDPAGTWDSGLLHLLASVDVLLPNETEACALAGTTDVVAAARALAAYGPTVVVKRGAAGALLAGPDGLLEVGAHPVAAVETTGAGDSFDAGYLAGLLGGEAAPAALRLASACGALSTLAVGGTAGQPDATTARRVAAGLPVTRRTVDPVPQEAP